MTLIKYMLHCLIVLAVVYLIFSVLGGSLYWFYWAERLRNVFYIIEGILAAMAIFGIDINHIRNKK